MKSLEESLADGERFLRLGHTKMISDSRTATAGKFFNADVILGQLQTERYAEAVLRNAPLPSLPESLVRKLLQIRISHQWELFERADPPILDVILDEAVLHRSFGGQEVLREQLIHLRGLTEEPNLHIYVLPYNAGYYPHIEDFLLWRCQADWKAYTEDLVEACKPYDNPFVVETFLLLWERTREHCLSEHNSAAFIEELIERIDVDKLSGSTGPNRTLAR